MCKLDVDCVHLFLLRQVSAPAFVYQLDLMTQAWPQQQQQQQSGSSDSGRPRSVLLYTLCSPGGCYTDWHIDFGGSAVWYHMIQVGGLLHTPLINLQSFWATCKAAGPALVDRLPI